MGPDVLILNPRAEPDLVEDAIDRLESTDPAQGSILQEYQAYSDVYGVLSPDDLSKMLPSDQDQLAERIRETVQRVEIHVDASEDVAVVAEVAGPAGQEMQDLSKLFGAALSMGRLNAKREDSRRARRAARPRAGGDAGAAPSLGEQAGGAALLGRRGAARRAAGEPRPVSSRPARGRTGTSRPSPSQRRRDDARNASGSPIAPVTAALELLHDHRLEGVREAQAALRHLHVQLRVAARDDAAADRNTPRPSAPAQLPRIERSGGLRRKVMHSCRRRSSGACGMPCRLK